MGYISLNLEHMGEDMVDYGEPGPAGAPPPPGVLDGSSPAAAAAAAKNDGSSASNSNSNTLFGEANSGREYALSEKYTVWQQVSAASLWVLLSQEKKREKEKEKADKEAAAAAAAAAGGDDKDKGDENAVREKKDRDSKDKDDNGYSNSTRQIAEFETVQQFWAVWNRLPQPSEILTSRMVSSCSTSSTASQPTKKDELKGKAGEVAAAAQEALVGIDAVMVFLWGVKPAWEDPANRTGGHLQYALKRSLFEGGMGMGMSGMGAMGMAGNSGAATPGLLDQLWNNLILALVGGTLDADLVDEEATSAVQDADSAGAGGASAGVGADSGGKRLRVTGVRLLDKLTVNENASAAKDADGSRREAQQANLRIEVWFSEWSGAGKVVKKLQSRVERAMLRGSDEATVAQARNFLKCEVKSHKKD